MEEKRYKVIVINDATAAPRDAAYDAALVNYGLIAHESISAEEALSRF